MVKNGCGKGVVVFTEPFGQYYNKYELGSELSKLQKSIGRLIFCCGHPIRTGRANGHFGKEGCEIPFA